MRRYYQLTHDYLVHSLRDWLTRKQRETRRRTGGAAASGTLVVWNAKPENRHLPSATGVGEHPAADKEAGLDRPQRRMMKRAGRVHGLRALGLVIAGLP